MVGRLLQIWQRSVEFFLGGLFGSLYVGSKGYLVPNWPTKVLAELA